jgi:hypothetical protein
MNDIPECDLKKMAVVGVDINRAAKIRNRTERRCGVCRKHIYFSRCVLRQAEKQADSQGDGSILVCWNCARHWIADVARNGGDMAASEGPMRDEVIPALEREIEFINRQN